MKHQEAEFMEQGASLEGHEFVEGVRIRLEPAPSFRRTIAAIIDVGIITAALYIAIVPLLFFVLGSLFVDFGTFKSGGVPIFTILLFVLFGIASIVGFHGYYVYFETKTGMTPGKKMLGLKVVSVDGQRLTRGQAVYREIARWYLDLLFFLPGLISMLVTQKRQRIGDLLAGTMVVYSKARDEKQNFLYVRQEDFNVLQAHLNPPVVAKELRERFLKFAYPAFVLGQYNPSSQEALAWRDQARSVLKPAESLGLNDVTVLRFFAELCFQLDRKEQL